MGALQRGRTVLTSDDPYVTFDLHFCLKGFSLVYVDEIWSEESLAIL